MDTASAICLPIVIVGFNEVMGSWKTIPISLPRTLRISVVGEADQIPPVESGWHRRDVAAAREQAHDRHRRHRLAAAGLADDPDRLARLDIEAQTVDGVHRSAAEPDPRLQVVHLEQCAMARSALLQPDVEGVL